MTNRIFTTSDVGYAVKENIEGRALWNDESYRAERIAIVDGDDPDNLIVVLSTGQRFKMTITEEGQA